MKFNYGKIVLVGFTGIYYIAFTLAAILGPNLNGWIVQLSGGNYNLIMLASACFFTAAIACMLGGQGRGAESKFRVGAGLTLC